MTSQTANQKGTFDYGNSLRQCKFFPNISSLKALASMAHLCWACSNYNGWAHFKCMLPGSHTCISLCCAASFWRLLSSNLSLLKQYISMWPITQSCLGNSIYQARRRKNAVYILMQMKHSHSMVCGMMNISYKH